MANLHKQCFPDKPWSETDFADLKKSGCEIIASQNGFIVYRSVIDTGEIISIGVAPNARCNGIGAAMLGLAEHDMSKNGVHNIFLEVNAKNTPAIALYRSAGYNQIGIRPKYYDGVDAILMEKRI
ncbi:MAG: GNAT family N-acetyltransferase [Alphaproteobacteria bacterium]|nr:GNAT family N-acetyltransferase [Alphaproteobacteria bacterium]